MNLREQVTKIALRHGIAEEPAYEAADSILQLFAERKNHCLDCCCARAWRALGITKYTRKSIAEHISEHVAVGEKMAESLRFYASAENRGLKRMGTFGGGEVYGDALLMDNGKLATESLAAYSALTANEKGE